MSVLLIIFITAIIVLFSGTYRQGKWTRWLGILGLSFAFGVSFLPEHHFWLRYQKMFLFSEVSAVFTQISLMASMLIFLLGDYALYRHRNHQSEIYALMLFSLCGGIILFGFQNFIVLFLGIELLSIPLYVLAGSDKTNPQSIEASVKYFLIGAFATGFLLMGFAFIYGSLGSFEVQELKNLINSHSHQEDNWQMIGVLLVLGALGFKIALVPFHFWSPDVYEGASSWITLFMASVVKIAGFFAFFEFFSLFYLPREILYFLGVASLIIPSILGIIQPNVKRMLAYSSIANVGYLLLIFLGDNTHSYDILAFYLWAYSVANIGVFLGLIVIEAQHQHTAFSCFNGLAKSQRLLAVMMSISLFSLAGIPFTAGFIGKLQLFLQAIDEAPVLIIVAVIASVVSVVYYLKLIVAMFFKSNENLPKYRLPNTFKIVSVIVILLIIIFGVFPKIAYF